jgi:ribosomal protein S12 methylthiotransferase accessory factor
MNEKIEKFQDIFLFTLTHKKTNFQSFGKGKTLLQAKLSAYGEMYERLYTKNFFEDFFIENLYEEAKVTNFLNKELKNFYKIDLLEKEELIDFNSNSFEILSIPFKHKNHTIYFPINLIQNLYASNGMAYHKNFKSAYYNAKCEIIERYVKFKVIKGNIPLPKVKEFEKITIYDASLGEYPVMAASFIENNEVILSFGCDETQEIATQKALIELFQTKFKKRGKIVEQIDDIEFQLERHFINLSGDIPKNILFNNVTYNKWDKIPLKKYENEFIREIRTKKGIALHLIIPTISEVYPIDDLIFNNKNRGKFYRKDVLKRNTKALEEFEYLELGSFIGIEFEEPLFLSNIKKHSLRPSKRYKNIKKFSKLKELNEI